ncbi:condensation domain-containing protein, partial [Xanthomonas sp. LMG 8992]|uniref:non-ribosomal peptide synthetase n=1 Tax=Xanthomonas sp. LMG 8992 TaxID=1591157 RepID=UPI00136C7978
MKLDAQAGPWMPLSAAQRSRWFLYRLAPDARGEHNNAFAAVVHGALAADCLLPALQALVRRHPMLRLRFRDNAGEVEQSVSLSADVPLILDDTAAIAPDALLRRVRNDAIEPFDLFRCPPIRAGLYRRDDDTQILMLAFDHIAVDGWSYWRLLDELGTLLGGKTVADEADAKVGYEDYVHWQAQWLQSAQAQAQRHYWHAALQGAAQNLPLPADRPASQASGRFDEVALTIPLSLALDLHALGRRHGSTLYTTLLAAYMILLHRHSGQDDISVGSPMPGRTRSEWDAVVGDFVNPVVLRTVFQNAASLADVLHTVRTTALRGMKNQEYPFTSLVEELQPARMTGQHPFYQTMFVFQNARHGGGLRRLWDGTHGRELVAWGGVGLSAYPACRSGAHHGIPLLLEVIELEQGIRCAFKFDHGVFDQQTVARLGNAWLMLLQGMVADDAQAVSRLPLLSADEREQVLHTFNATRMDVPQDTPIHALFQAQASRQPQALALACGDQQLSYGALNARANQLAHRLIALGVQPDTRVAICLPRSVEMVVGILAILKAGGAYVPLDPAYPAERLAYMLADAEPVALLTQARLVETVRTLGGDETAVAIVAVDDDPALALQPAHDPVVAGLSARHLAYVIYTSGSTGRPKGVMLTHANAVNLVAWAQASFSTAQLATTLLSTSINFDLAVFELFVPLSSGRTVRLVADLVSAGQALDGTT